MADPYDPNTSIINQLLAPFQPTPGFVNKQFVSPAMINALRNTGTQTSAQMPVHRPTEGIANIIKSLVGGNEGYQADQLDQSRQQTIQNAVGDAASTSISNGGVAPAAAPAAYVPPTTPGGVSQGGVTAATGSVGAPSPGFNGAVARTLGFEGGMNASDTNGTPSNFGINQAANPDVNVANLTQDQAKQIYKQRYWDPIGADSMSPALARVAFDTSVVAGPQKAQDLVAQSGGDPNKLMDLRESFQNGLIQSDPQKYGPYANAWAQRNAGLRSDVAQMSNGAPQQGGHHGAFTPADAGLLLGGADIPDAARKFASDIVNPPIIRDGNNYPYMARPGQQAVSLGTAPTVLQGTVGAGGANVPTMTTVGPNGIGPTHLQVPAPAAPQPRPNGAPAAPAGPLDGIAPIVKQSQQMSADGTALNTETGNDVNTLNHYKDEGVRAQANLGQLANIGQLAAKADYGAVPQLQGVLSNYGIETRGLSDQQAFTKAVESFAGDDPASAGFKSALPTMLTTPAGRQAAVQNIQMLAQRKAMIGQIATNEDLPSSIRMQMIQHLPPPQLVMPQSDAPQPTQTAPTPASPAAPRQIVSSADYAALPSGSLFIAPDGTTRRKP